MSEHGGTRDGAGRKPAFDLVERLAIGGEFERRLADERLQIRWERYENRPGMDEVRRAQADYRSEADEAGRATFMASARGRELSSEVEEAVRTMRSTPKIAERTIRLLEIPELRAKGLRTRLAEEIAAYFTERLGRTVTPRMANRCLNEHRSLFRDEK